MLWKTSPEKQGHPSLDTAVHIRHQSRQNRHPPATPQHGNRKRHIPFSRRQRGKGNYQDGEGEKREVNRVTVLTRAKKSMPGVSRANLICEHHCYRASLYLQGCNYIFMRRGHNAASLEPRLLDLQELQDWLLLVIRETNL